MIRCSPTRVPTRQLSGSTRAGPTRCPQPMNHPSRNRTYSTSKLSVTTRKGISITPSLSRNQHSNKPSQHHHHLIHRTIHTTSPRMATSQEESNKKPNDWSATQYLKFNTERTRAVFDLIGRITPHLAQTAHPKIYDLGCGPGNSASILLSAFPSASLTGLDNSPDMLQKARATLPHADFVHGDLSTFTPAPDADLVFSNAAFHWLRRDTRIPTLLRLFDALQPGAVLAIQVPDNYTEPSHALMRDVATTPSKPWSAYFSASCSGAAGVRVGDVTDTTRPDLDPIESPREWYDAFTSTSSGRAASVDIWRTTYHHVLQDARAIVEWVKGTGLQPFLQRMPAGEVTEAFLREYEERLRGRYPKLADGKVLLAYPRLFVVVVRA